MIIKWERKIKRQNDMNEKKEGRIKWENTRKK